MSAQRRCQMVAAVDGALLLDSLRPFFAVRSLAVRLFAFSGVQPNVQTIHRHSDVCPPENKPKRKSVASASAPTAFLTSRCARLNSSLGALHSQRVSCGTTRKGRRFFLSSSHHHHETPSLASVVSDRWIVTPPAHSKR